MSKDSSDWYNDIMNDACQLGLYTGSPTILNTVSKTKWSKRRRIEINERPDDRNVDLFQTPFVLSQISKISPSRTRRQSKQVRFVESNNSYKIQTTEVKFENNTLSVDKSKKDFSFNIDEEDKYYDFDKLKSQSSIEKQDSRQEISCHKVSSFWIIDGLQKWSQADRDEDITINQVIPAKQEKSNSKISLNKFSYLMKLIRILEIIEGILIICSVVVACIANEIYEGTTLNFLNNALSNKDKEWEITLFRWTNILISVLLIITEIMSYYWKVNLKAMYANLNYENLNYSSLVKENFYAFIND